MSNGWNVLDFGIVCVSLLTLLGNATESLKALRTLRTLRALRPLRVISRNPGLKLVVNALFRAIPSILNVVFVSTLFFLIFGIVGVTYFKGAFHACQGPVFDGLTAPQVNLVVYPVPCVNLFYFCCVRATLTVHLLALQILGTFRRATVLGKRYIRSSTFTRCVRLAGRRLGTAYPPDFRQRDSGVWNSVRNVNDRALGGHYVCWRGCQRYVGCGKFVVRSSHLVHFANQAHTCSPSETQVRAGSYFS